ncbi:hypothetical protein Clacol_010085 [Clathrus columnatus]|uniref:Uncharacterized protein n=1 Tax=Clathrus columnatus TaxID=1419009 RepID=A0AAV5APX5_9AGAM|nr:hypothetical protein Clacol_010085 [Clathrus columnatus]
MSLKPKPKVICLGLGRTGTSSLREALKTLGFGPCHHMIVILRNKDPKEIKTWTDLGQGSATLDDIRTLLKDYNSIQDYPAVIYFEELYKAYPDAKFILVCRKKTTREPAKWEASMKVTILPAVKTFLERTPDPDPFLSCLREWFDIEMLGRYHRGKLYTDTQDEIIAHNQRVIQTIPADKLLVYDVSQGWEPLVNFLGVEKPDIPFPHVNDTARFQKRYMGSDISQRPKSDGQAISTLVEKPDAHLPDQPGTMAKL